MRNAVVVLASLACVAACATGTVSTGTPVGDAGIVFKGDASPANHDGSTTPPPSDDDASGPTCTGGKTLCDGACVNTNTNANDCGGCDIACDANSTCSGGQCIPNAPTSNAPPQGQCSHSLCTTGDALDEDCDPAECTVVICDPEFLWDDYCCDTSWDAQCVQEVDDYCQPYSCE
jgi:hypothetical protein